MKILTWNVLHRVHAETHTEPCILRWPEEAARVKAIAAKVFNALTGEGFEVALLQEVSGDQLAALRARLPGWSVLNHLYPRVPRQKSASLRDPSEHLVVVAPPGAKIVRAQTFENDPGKGFLMASVRGGLKVISTHISWGPKAVPQLTMLARLMEEVSDSVCLGGDFNAEREMISRGLGLPIPAPPEGSLRSRPKEGGGSDIDHLICKHATLSDVRVLEHGDLSDHRPVAATITVA